MESARIRLGVLRLANGGTVLSFTAETNTPAFDPAAWYGQHLNNSNRVVDFGDARTDGSALLRREGDGWVLKTWPRERSFTLELSRQPIWPARQSAMHRRRRRRGHSRADRLALAPAAQRRDGIPLDQQCRAATKFQERSLSAPGQHRATLPEPPQGPRPAPFPTPLQPEGCAPMPVRSPRLMPTVRR